MMLGVWLFRVSHRSYSTFSRWWQSGWGSPAIRHPHQSLMPTPGGVKGSISWLIACHLTISNTERTHHRNAPTFRITRPKLWVCFIYLKPTLHPVAWGKSNQREENGVVNPPSGLSLFYYFSGFSWEKTFILAKELSQESKEEKKNTYTTQRNDNKIYIVRIIFPSGRSSSILYHVYFALPHSAIFFLYASAEYTSSPPQGDIFRTKNARIQNKKKGYQERSQKEVKTRR